MGRMYRGLELERPQPILGPRVFEPTDFHCGQPATCSAFSSTSLVLTISYPVRVPMLLAYADWFASVLFFLTATGSGQCDECRERTAAQERAACHCVRGWNASFSGLRSAHYGPAMAHAVALAGQGRSVGVLLCHFDFFLNVRIFHGVSAPPTSGT